MPAKNIFEEEEIILTMAEKILDGSEPVDDQLADCFSTLVKAYSKLLKQHKRIIRVSDKQQTRLSLLNRSMKQILDHIPVGIVVLEEDGRVYPMYSRFMHQLFGKKTKIEGVRIENLLYWEEGREKERNTLKKWLDLVFDTAYDWDLIGDLGPDMIQHASDNGDLYYRNSFHRIIRQNGELALMVYIVDVSDRIRQKMKLKEIEAVHNFELEALSCFVNAENAVELADFMDETEKMVKEATGVFEDLGKASDKMPLYHHMFRLMHSVKGLSRTYGLNQLGQLAHVAEDILDRYRNLEMTFESGRVDGVLGTERIASILEKMTQMLENCENIIHKIVNHGRENAAMIRSRRRGLKIDEHCMDDLMRKVGELKSVPGESEKFDEKVNHLLARMFQLTLQPLDAVYNRLHHIVKDVSDSLGKKAELSIEGVRVYLAPEAHHHVITSLIHILRNALDHGIEPPDEREKQGKAHVGRIHLSAQQDDRNVTIEVRDDGRGINPQEIAEIAVRKGLVDNDDVRKMSDRQKIELILLPGFSGRESVSEFSGRGVGMDVVAEAMKHLKGELAISSQIGEGTVIRMTFPEAGYTPE